MVETGFDGSEKDLNSIHFRKISSTRPSPSVQTKQPFGAVSILLLLLGLLLILDFYVSESQKLVQFHLQLRNTRLYFLSNLGSPPFEGNELCPNCKVEYSLIFYCNADSHKCRCLDLLFF